MRRLESGQMSNSMLYLAGNFKNAQSQNAPLIMLQYSLKEILLAIKQLHEILHDFVRVKDFWGHLEEERCKLQVAERFGEQKGVLLAKAKKNTGPQ
jgi:hypothetical protein